MIEDTKSFYAQVGNEAVLRRKIRVVFIFILLFITHLLSAQETNSQQKPNSGTLITVVGDAVIYSKDEAFNQQVRNNENLKSHSKIETDQNKNLIISAKNVEKNPKPLPASKKKPENIVVASKKVYKYKTDNFPKKNFHIQIKNQDEGSRFLTASSDGHISFVSPNNHYSSSKYFIVCNKSEDNICLKFLDNTNYLYKNSNPKSDVFTHDFSVRPPPGLI